MILTQSMAQPLNKMLLSCTLLYAAAGLATFVAGTHMVQHVQPSSIMSTQPGASDPQLESLMLLQAAVDPDNVLGWSRKSGANAGYCNWEGIMCSNKMITNISMPLSDHGYYDPKYYSALPPASALSALTSLKAVSLMSAGLKGTLPADWSQLTQLEHLEVFVSNGTIPAAWGNLTNLKTLLVFGDGGVTGQLPDSFRRLTMLENLTVYGPLSGSLPAWIGALSRLKKVRIAQTSMSGSIPDSWQALTSLRTLGLFDMPLVGTIPAWLGRLTGLSELYLYNLTLSGSIPSSLGNLQQLTVLMLSLNNLSGVLPESLADLRALQKLDLDSDYMLSGTIPAAWSRLTATIVLDWNRQLKGCVPKGMKQYQVSYDGTNITGPC